MQLQIAAKSTDEENFDKMKAAYESCLDEDEIKSVGAEPLLQILRGLQSSKGETSINDMLRYLAKYGVDALVATGTGADDTDPDTVVVSVGAPWRIGLPSKERYEDDELVEKYRNVVVEVLDALFPDWNTEYTPKIVDLEKKLAAASPSEEEREDVTVSLTVSHITSTALTPL